MNRADADAHRAGEQGLDVVDEVGVGVRRGRDVGPGAVGVRRATRPARPSGPRNRPSSALQIGDGRRSAPQAWVRFVARAA